jgi:hypothetical protein
VQTTPRCARSRALPTLDRKQILPLIDTLGERETLKKPQGIPFQGLLTCNCSAASLPAAAGRVELRSNADHWQPTATVLSPLP